MSVWYPQRDVVDADGGRLDSHAAESACFSLFVCVCVRERGSEGKKHKAHRAHYRSQLSICGQTLALHSSYQQMWQIDSSLELNDSTAFHPLSLYLLTITPVQKLTVPLATFCQTYSRLN